jgi:transposase-like protein
VFVKPEQRRQARALRAEQGMSIKEIAARVGVSVSSVSLWVRDIALTPEQQAALDARNPRFNGQRLGAQRWSERCRERRLVAQHHGRELARRGDPEFAAGCMLYWAEGSKRRNAAELVNADAALLRTFVRFVERFYDIARSQFTFSVHCFTTNGLTVAEIEQWWLGQLGLPGSCRRAAVVNRASSASRGRRHRVLLYGTGRLAVHSTFVVQSIYGGIQEIAGVDRPEWLDL